MKDASSSTFSATTSQLIPQNLVVSVREALETASWCRDVEDRVAWEEPPAMTWHKPLLVTTSSLIDHLKEETNCRLRAGESFRGLHSCS